MYSLTFSSALISFLHRFRTANDIVYTSDMHNASILCILCYVMICIIRPVRRHSKGVSRRRGFFCRVWPVDYVWHKNWNNICWALLIAQGLNKSRLRWVGHDVSDDIRKMQEEFMRKSLWMRRLRIPRQIGGEHCNGSWENKCWTGWIPAPGADFVSVVLS
jgi:hypothetical protein